MTDRIFIKDLLVRCVLGLSAEERREKQDVLINVVLFADLAKAGKSDRAEDTVDYRAVKYAILSAVEGSQYHLAEALAEAVAQSCLSHPGGDAPTAARAGSSRGFYFLSHARSETAGGPALLQRRHRGGRRFGPARGKKTAAADRAGPG